MSRIYVDMKKTVLLLVGVSIIIILNAYLLLFYINSRQLLKGRINVTNNIAHANAEELSRYIIASTILLQNGGLSIENCKMIDVISHKIQDKDSLFDEGRNHLLVCRISQNTCEACVSYAIEKAVEFLNNDSINIGLAVFGQYSDDRTLKIYGDNHSHCDDLRYYNVKELNIPVDDFGKPFYFVVNRDMVVSDVFVPEQISPDFTDMYFEILKNKWQ